jgi:hypothetical protein
MITHSAFMRKLNQLPHQTRRRPRLFAWIGTLTHQACSIPLSVSLMSLIWISLILTGRTASWAAESNRPFAIEVVDESTGRGVPLVELETLNHLRWVTDSNGLVAIDEPELMGRKVFFTVRSHGYEFPADGFGFRGKALQVVRNGTARLMLRRKNLAERLYRLTGSGIDRDSLLLGRSSPRGGLMLRADVFGCDSVLSAVYRDRIYWFWGDTTRPHYPIGANFHVSGATSPRPADSTLKPDLGVPYDYFVGPDGAVRPLAKMPGDGPTWISALTVLKDASGQERMYASYVKVRNQLESYRWGFVVWNDERAEFESVRSFDQRPTPFCEPQSHSFLHTDHQQPYVYFAHPLPWTRVPAQSEAFLDPQQYESYTCLKQGTQATDKQLERNRSGRLIFSWKRHTPTLSTREIAMLIKDGLMKPEESPFVLRDVQTGRSLQVHSGSVAWNAYRQRWVSIAVEQSGESSFLGEVWFAESDEPTGPWHYARKIVTHDQYSFYNPKHHAFFDEDGGRAIYFEGTYTHTFSGNPVITPRYDYNQILYRLDLARPELHLPVAYSAAPEKPSSSAQSVPPFTRWQASHKVAFYACDQPTQGSQALIWTGNRCILGDTRPDQGRVLFYALPPGGVDETGLLVHLFEFFQAESNAYAYSLDPNWKSPGYQRLPQAVCRVWKAG